MKKSSVNLFLAFQAVIETDKWLWSRLRLYDLCLRVRLKISLLSFRIIDVFLRRIQIEARAGPFVGMRTSGHARQIHDYQKIHNYAKVIFI